MPTTFLVVVVGVGWYHVTIQPPVVIMPSVEPYRGIVLRIVLGIILRVVLIVLRVVPVLGIPI